MKTVDIQNKNHDGLVATLEELKAKMLRLQFDLADKKLKDFSQIKKTRQDIARVLTAMKNVK